MKQALLKQQGVLAISDIEEDLSLRANEVLIEVKAVTICGSDLNNHTPQLLPGRNPAASFTVSTDSGA